METPEEFRERYSRMSDDELFRLHAVRETLTDIAQTVLVAETQSRRLVGERYEAVAADNARWAREAELDIGDVGVILPYGIGKTFLGKKVSNQDDADETNKFTSNLWVLIFWLPLYPIGTYRLQCRQGRYFWNLDRDDIVVLERLPRDWGLATLTFVKAIVAIAAFLYLFRSLALL